MLWAAKLRGVKIADHMSPRWWVLLERAERRKSFLRTLLTTLEHTPLWRARRNARKVQKCTFLLHLLQNEPNRARGPVARSSIEQKWSKTPKKHTIRILDISYSGDCENWGCAALALVLRWKKWIYSEGVMNLRSRFFIKKIGIIFYKKTHTQLKKLVTKTTIKAAERYFSAESVN